MKSIGSAISKVYKNYRYKIYPKINHIRGTTRIAKKLEKAAWKGLENIDEEHNIRDLEWDNLIILDACRHDLYEEVNGSTDYINSVGGASREFIEKTFGESDFSDTVYITANPYFFPELFEESTGKKPEDVFHEVFHVYKSEWNEKENTVMPEKVVEKAMTAEKLWPDKRKIIHFMQPHYPFIEADFSDAGFDTALEGEEAENIWVRLMKGDLDHDRVKEAYKRNLEVVMPHAEELAENLTGKTVITADHGNLLGENGLYGHPEKCRAKALRKVPWHEMD